MPCILFNLSPKINAEDMTLAGAHLSAPYVDQYGETDDSLVRGNPLHLDAEKYAALDRMWLLHEIPDKISSMFDPEAFVIQEHWSKY